MRAFVKACRDLAKDLNGPWWGVNASHYCSGVHCCPQGHRSVKERVEATLLATAFKGAPAPPAVNKWTKLGPVIDLLIFSLLANNMFHRLFHSLDYKQEVFVDGSMDMQLIQEVMFSAVAGSRYADSKTFLSDPASLPAMICLGLALEPIRVMTAWWMRRARHAEMYTCRCPLMDVLNRGTSIVIVALQYISSFLGGRSNRLLLLWRSGRFASYEEWFAACPGQVKLLRRLMLLVSASTYRRHWRQLITFPWAFASIADERVPIEAREAIAAEFDIKNACCLTAGMARKFKGRGITGHMLLHDQQLQALLLAFAQIVKMQICDVEWRHKRNRTRSQRHGQTRWNCLCRALFLQRLSLRMMLGELLWITRLAKITQLQVKVSRSVRKARMLARKTH